MSTKLVMSSKTRGKLLLVHHFPLSEVTGVTVMISELLKLIPQIDDQIEVGYLNFANIDEPHELISLIEEHRPSNVVGINLHIEVRPDLSRELARWCAEHHVSLYNYVQDYWPHHFTALRQLTDKFHLELVAPSPFIQKLLKNDGFISGYLPMGVQLPTGPFSSIPHNVIGSVGRMVPRKRWPDVVQAFCLAGLDKKAELHLTLLPSRVFARQDDEEQLLLIRSEVEKPGVNKSAIHLRMTPIIPPDYSSFSIYVCASDYEGFSMTPYEAAYSGCPPVVSDIPPHRLMAESLFSDQAEEFLYPVGDVQALANRLRAEISSGHRRQYLQQNQLRIRKIIKEQYSLRVTADALVRMFRQKASA